MFVSDDVTASRSDTMVGCVFFFQAEDGIRYLVRSRGLGDVYKRQTENASGRRCPARPRVLDRLLHRPAVETGLGRRQACLLYTSDAADERSSVDLGGRRLIQKNKKKKNKQSTRGHHDKRTHTHTIN